MKEKTQPDGLTTEKLDEAILAMLSLNLRDDEIGNRPGIQAEAGFN